MLISTACELAREFARNGGDRSYYSDFQVGTSVRAVLSEMCRRASLLTTTTTITLASGSKTFTVTSPLFRPDRLRSAYLSGSNVQVNYGAPSYNSWQYVEGGPDPAQNRQQSATLDVKGLADLNDRQISIPGPAQPTMIAFNTWTTGSVWPIPDQDYTLNFSWFDFPTVWTPGSALLAPTVSGGALTGLVVNQGGSNLGAAAITFSGGGGTGATATATVAGGAITVVNVTAGGTGYTSTPDVFVNGVLCTDAIINIPDDLLYSAIIFGAPAFLQHNDPEHAFATPSGQKFKDYVDSLIGSAGGLGGASIQANRRRR